jgi:predicted DNA-binding transcriptional regulator AlpA
VTDLSSTGSTPDRLITERATAEILGISPDTLRRLSHRGEGPTRRKISPRRVGYKISEVAAYRDGILSASGDAPPTPKRQSGRRRAARLRRNSPSRPVPV